MQRTQHAADVSSTQSPSAPRTMVSPLAATQRLSHTLNTQTWKSFSLLKLHDLSSNQTVVDRKAGEKAIEEELVLSVDDVLSRSLSHAAHASSSAALSGVRVSSSSSATATATHGSASSFSATFSTPIAGLCDRLLSLSLQSTSTGALSQHFSTRLQAHLDRKQQQLQQLLTDYDNEKREREAKNHENVESRTRELESLFEQSSKRIHDYFVHFHEDAQRLFHYSQHAMKSDKQAFIESFTQLGSAVSVWYNDMMEILAQQCSSWRCSIDQLLFRLEECGARVQAEHDRLIQQEVSTIQVITIRNETEINELNMRLLQAIEIEKYEFLKKFRAMKQVWKTKRIEYHKEKFSTLFQSNYYTLPQFRAQLFQSLQTHQHAFLSSSATCLHELSCILPPQLSREHVVDLHEKIIKQYLEYDEKVEQVLKQMKKKEDELYDESKNEIVKLSNKFVELDRYTEEMDEHDLVLNEPLEPRFPSLAASPHQTADATAATTTATNNNNNAAAATATSATSSSTTSSTVSSPTSATTSSFSSSSPASQDSTSHEALQLYINTYCTPLINQRHESVLELFHRVEKYMKFTEESYMATFDSLIQFYYLIIERFRKYDIAKNENQQHYVETLHQIHDEQDDELRALEAQLNDLIHSLKYSPSQEFADETLTSIRELVGPNGRIETTYRSFHDKFNTFLMTWPEHIRDFHRTIMSGLCDVFGVQNEDELQHRARLLKAKQEAEEEEKRRTEEAEDALLSKKDLAKKQKEKERLKKEAEKEAKDKEEADKKAKEARIKEALKPSQNRNASTATKSSKLSEEQEMKILLEIDQTEALQVLKKSIFESQKIFYNYLDYVKAYENENTIVKIETPIPFAQLGMVEIQSGDLNDIKEEVIKEKKTRSQLNSDDVANMIIVPNIDEIVAAKFEGKKSARKQSLHAPHKSISNVAPPTATTSSPSASPTTNNSQLSVSIQSPLSSPISTTMINSSTNQNINTGSSSATVSPSQSPSPPPIPVLPSSMTATSPSSPSSTASTSHLPHLSLPQSILQFVQYLSQSDVMDKVYKRAHYTPEELAIIQENKDYIKNYLGKHELFLTESTPSAAAASDAVPALASTSSSPSPVAEVSPPVSATRPASSNDKDKPNSRPSSRADGKEKEKKLTKKQLQEQKQKEEEERLKREEEERLKAEADAAAAALLDPSVVPLDIDGSPCVAVFKFPFHMFTPYFAYIRESFLMYMHMEHLSSLESIITSCSEQQLINHTELNLYMRKYQNRFVRIEMDIHQPRVKQLNENQLKYNRHIERIKNSTQQLNKKLFIIVLKCNKKLEEFTAAVHQSQQFLSSIENLSQLHTVAKTVKQKKAELTAELKSYFSQFNTLLRELSAQSIDQNTSFISSCISQIFHAIDYHNDTGFISGATTAANSTRSSAHHSRASSAGTYRSVNTEALSRKSSNKSLDIQVVDGVYHEEEVNMYTQRLNEINSMYKQILANEEQKLAEIKTKFENTLHTKEFDTAFDVASNDLSISCGLGHRNGLPKRTLTLKIRTEYSRNQMKEEEIAEILRILQRYTQARKQHLYKNKPIQTFKTQMVSSDTVYLSPPPLPSAVANASSPASPSSDSTAASSTLSSLQLLSLSNTLQSSLGHMNITVPTDVDLTNIAPNTSLFLFQLLNYLRHVVWIRSQYLNALKPQLPPLPFESATFFPASSSVTSLLTPANATTSNNSSSSRPNSRGGAKDREKEKEKDKSSSSSKNKKNKKDDDVPHDAAPAPPTLLDLVSTAITQCKSDMNILVKDYEKNYPDRKRPTESAEKKRDEELRLKELEEEKNQPLSEKEKRAKAKAKEKEKSGSGSSTPTRSSSTKKRGKASSSEVTDMAPLLPLAIEEHCQHEHERTMQYLKENNTVFLKQLNDIQLCLHDMLPYYINDLYLICSTQLQNDINSLHESFSKSYQHSIALSTKYFTQFKPTINCRADSTKNEVIQKENHRYEKCMKLIDEFENNAFQHCSDNSQQFLAYLCIQSSSLLHMVDSLLVPLDCKNVLEAGDQLKKKNLGELINEANRLKALRAQLAEKQQQEQHASKSSHKSDKKDDRDKEMKESSLASPLHARKRSTLDESHRQELLAAEASLRESNAMNVRFMIQEHSGVDVRKIEIQELVQREKLERDEKEKLQQQELEQSNSNKKKDRDSHKKLSSRDSARSSSLTSNSTTPSARTSSTRNKRASLSSNQVIVTTPQYITASISCFHQSLQHIIVDIRNKCYERYVNEFQHVLNHIRTTISNARQQQLERHNEWQQLQNVSLQANAHPLQHSLSATLMPVLSTPSTQSGSSHSALVSPTTPIKLPSIHNNRADTPSRTGSRGKK